MKTVDTIPEDVYALFNRKEHHECSEENLDAFAHAVKELVRSRLAQEEIEEGRGAIRFSNLGKPDRYLWYKQNEPDKEEDISNKNLLKFLYGDVIEQLMLFLIKEAGHEVSDEQKEIEVDGIKGRIDCTIDGITVDIKSASPYSFQKFKKGTLFEDDPFGYIGQISGYASQCTPDVGAAFVAFDKVHGDINVLKVPPKIVHEYDPPSRIESIKKTVGQDEVPPRCHSDVEDGKSGNRKLGTNCSYCGFKEHCWPGLRTFFYSGGPRFLTTVAKLPDVPEKGVSASIGDEDIAPF